MKKHLLKYALDFLVIVFGISISFLIEKRNANNYKEELQKEPKGLIFHTISQLQKDYNDLVKLAYKNNSTDFQSFNEFVLQIELLKFNK